MELEDAKIRRELGGFAIRIFFKLTQPWQLSREQAMTLLGVTASSTYANWKNGKANNLPRDTLERIGYVIAISKSLDGMFSGQTALIQHWLTTPNAMSFFSYQAPLEFMLQGNVANLFLVKQLLIGLPSQFIAPDQQIQNLQLLSQETLERDITEEQLTEKDTAEDIAAEQVSNAAAQEDSEDEATLLAKSLRQKPLGSGLHQNGSNANGETS